FLRLFSTLISPFFPYTTLFRSSHKVTIPFQTLNRKQSQMRWKVKWLSKKSHIYNISQKQGIKTSLRRKRQSKERNRKWWFQDSQDRKSTRLNSSHVSISYAVFC